jgi:hypothetical protein
MNGERRYYWLNGKSITDIPFCKMPDLSRFKPECDGSETNFADLEPLILQKGTRDNALYHLAIGLVSGCLPENDMRWYLEFFAKHCDPPYNIRDIKYKIDSALKRAKAYRGNIAQSIRDWIEDAPGMFTTTMLDKELDLFTKQHRDARKIALHRLKNAGVIEETKQRGQYRVVNTHVERMEATDGDVQEIALKWPFGLEKLYRCLPKNIIVIAGESNSGKSAFLLNFVKNNMLSHNIHYFNSEMGDFELKSRLELFEQPTYEEFFEHVNWYESPGDNDDLASVVQPDGINIIDYIEISDEFYKIGKWIRDIYARLNQGICLIALQKNKGTDLGLGGARSIEKARLYLAMEKELLRIVKAKNWRDVKRNPNGLEIAFEIERGCNFKAVSDWV